MTTEELVKIVEQIVEENSGGIKFTELLSSVLSQVEPKSNHDIIGEVILAVDASKKLETLYYTWHCCNREKMFIYTP